jgi:hypothetical protein
MRMTEDISHRPRVMLVDFLQKYGHFLVSIAKLIVGNPSGIRAAA